MTVLSNACGFPIYRHDVGTIRFNDFLDDNGLIVKEIAELNFSVTIVNPANGTSITTHQHLVETIVGEDPFGPNQVTTSFTETGMIWNVKVPGVGTILQGIGRLVRDGDGNVIFLAGPHDLITGNTDAFCAYMAGT